MAAANREAVYAQMETFPIIRELELAGRMGQKGSYIVLDKEGNPRIDPKTGQPITRAYDFTGSGDVDLSRQTALELARIAPELAKLQLQSSAQDVGGGLSLGQAFSRQRRAELEALDPTRFGLYEKFLGDIRQGPSAESLAVTEAPVYERVGMPTGPRDTGSAAQMRSDLERQIAAGLAQAGTLDPAMIRAAEQAARARGTATGNILGNLSAFREARAVNEAIANADVQRRQQALGLLQSGQTTSDVANRQAQEAFQNILAATGQRNTAMQQTFAGQMAQQQQRQNIGQQNIANIQSALGLQPIVSQAAQLGGLQQGASPFSAPQLLQGPQMASPGQLMQMGSNFALTNAQNAFEASKANSPLAIAQGVTSSIGNLGQAFSSFGLAGCYVARECIPDQWEAFYFWKELVGPKWFKNLYDANAKAVANWIKDKPLLKKVVANWMLSKIKSIIPKS
jgi:hypothetical protein